LFAYTALFRSRASRRWPSPLRAPSRGAGCPRKSGVRRHRYGGLMQRPRKTTRSRARMGRPKLAPEAKKARIKIAPEITPEAKAALDAMVRPGRSQGDVISSALMAYQEP